MPAKSFAPSRPEWCLPSECEDCRLLADAPRNMPLFKTNLPRQKSTASRSAKTLSASSKASSCVSVQSISTKEIDPSDDASTMSSAGASPVSRPRSSKSNHADVHGPYCLRRPTLKEILDDTAPPPWNLAAFTEYASSNLCLENIEFVQDVAKYRQLYEGYIASSSTARVAASTRGLDGRASSFTPEQRIQLDECWDNIISLYIAQSSPREINIPGDIRSALAKTSTALQPPSPSHLDPALIKVTELIEDSILFGFLHEQKLVAEATEEVLRADLSSKRQSSPALDQVTSASLTSSAASRSKRPTSSAPFSNLSTAFARASGLKPSGARSAGTSPSDRMSIVSGSEEVYSSYTEWTDESPSLRNPSGLLSPATTRKSTSTPPTTPPASVLEEGCRSHSRSTKNSDTWKKVGKLFRKKSGQNMQRSQRNNNNVGSIMEE